MCVPACASVFSFTPCQPLIDMLMFQGATWSYQHVQWASSCLLSYRWTMLPLVRKENKRQSLLSPIFSLPVLINLTYPHSINFPPVPLLQCPLSLFFSASLDRLPPLPPPPSFFHCSSPLPSHSNLPV